jgi:hypothetical protein
MSDDNEGLAQDEGLARPHRRLLRRIFNGRTVPIVVDDRPFLTYKQAAGYLLSLAPEAREAAYLAMKAAAEPARDQAGEARVTATERTAPLP